MNDGKSTEKPVVTNRQFSDQSRGFHVSCRLAGVDVTKRQASKFRRGFGLAIFAKRCFLGNYTARRNHIEDGLAQKRVQLVREQEKDSPDADKILALDLTVKDLETELGQIDADHKALTTS